MNKFKRLLIVAAVLVLGGLGLWALTTKPQTTSTSNTQNSTQQSADITFGDAGQTVSYKGRDSQTALEVLRSLTDVEAEDAAYGAMVTGIHGVKSEKNSTYWAFYVDGAYASEGAGTFKTTSTQTIEWKLEKIQ